MIMDPGSPSVKPQLEGRSDGPDKHQRTHGDDTEQHRSLKRPGPTWGYGGFVNYRRPCFE